MTSHTISVDAGLLRSDREAAMYSREALAAATGGHVSPETIRRAESGKRVLRQKMLFVANALGQNIARYEMAVDQSQPSRSVLPVRLAGRWTAFWVEAQRGKNPIVQTEKCKLEQSFNLVSGRCFSNVNGVDRVEHIEGARIERQTFSGASHVEGWTRPNGSSLFQLHIGRNNDWMDGYTIWDDGDSEQIEVSRYVWVRDDSMDFAELVETAKGMMGLAKDAYQWRRNFWNG